MVVQFTVFLTLSTLICRGRDLSKCFSESLGIQDNESRLYISSGPHGFREEDFLSFSHYKTMGANDPRGMASLGPRA